MREIKRQRGAALILFFVMLIMGAAIVILSALNGGAPQMRDRINKQNDMRAIKEVLLSYAMTNPEYNTVPNGPGRLPCSDTNNDGAMDCNVIAVGLGRLPERIGSVANPVFLSDRYAGIGQQYWYAAALAFRQNSTSLNTSSTTTLTVDGVTGIAAVIIAPGPSINGQVRVNNNQASLYLESNNATGPDFLSNHTTDPTQLNDIVLPITVAEVMTYATLRVAQEFKRLLDEYYAANGNIYPADTAQFTTAMNATAWISANAWASTALSAYTRPTTSTATVQFTNCAIVFAFDQTKVGFTRSQRSC